MSAAVLDLRHALDVTQRKRRETLRAQCALRGIVMSDTLDDHGREAYVLTKGPLTRNLPGLDDVESFLCEPVAA